MKVLAFADIRTSVQLPDVEPDIVFLLGDVPARMVSRIDKKYSCRKIGVMGNHCHPGNFDDSSVTNIHGQIVTIDGVTFAGFEGSPDYKEASFGQHTENEARRFVRNIGEQPIDFVLAHSNPAYGEMELDDSHRGFRSFNDLIFSNQVSHFFHGHLHDPFVRQVEKCTIYSVYQYYWIPNLKL